MKKKCSDCKRNRKLTEYYRNQTGADGHITYCKDCYRKRKDPNIAKHYYKKNKNKIHKSSAKWAKANRPKRRAQDKLWKALVAGKLKKKPCKVCGNSKSEGHHPDYAKPLKVIWLCRLHHKQLHQRLNTKLQRRK